LLKVFKEHGYNVFGTIRPQTRDDISFKDVSSMALMPKTSRNVDAISSRKLGLPSSTSTTSRKTVLLLPPKAMAITELWMF
jgi:hypothetical protein